MAKPWLQALAHLPPAPDHSSIHPFIHTSIQLPLPTYTEREREVYTYTYGTYPAGKNMATEFSTGTFGAETAELQAVGCLPATNRKPI